MRKPARSAFTLVEILVVIAILVTVAAIITPVILRSKDAARGANDISNLRQLGQAAALYNDANGFMPAGCPTLVEANLVPTALCSGKLDPHEEGIGNRMVRRLAQDSEMYKELDVDYRLSFIGRREIGWPETWWDEAMAHAVFAGWLVDLAPSDNIASVDAAPGLMLVGRYRRLLLEGRFNGAVTNSERWALA